MDFDPSFIYWTLYGQLFVSIEPSITFRGVYAWETALNYGIFHLIIDEGGYRFGRCCPAWQIRSANKVWLVWLTAFVVFMVMQRTVVNTRVIYYHPTIIDYYNAYPEARPDWLEMTLFCFPFWLLTAILTLK